MSENKEDLIKLEISGFEPRQIKPVRRQSRADLVAPGWKQDNLQRQNNKSQKLELEPRARKSSNVHIEKDNSASYKKYRSMLIKTAVCAGILLAIFAIKSFNTPASNDIISGVKTVINHEVDIDEIGRLKFVSTDEAGAVPVMSAAIDREYVFPIDGKVETEFNEQIGGGVLIRSIGSKEVVSASSGVVGEINKQQGYIRIEHEDGLIAVYQGVVPMVEEGDTVATGQQIASLLNDELNISLTHEGVEIDPIDCFMKGGF